MRHGGCLIGHPPHQHTWVLGVPTLVLFYSCLMCITDAPFRLWQTLVFSHSRIGGQLCALLYPVPGPILHPLILRAAIVTDSLHSVFQLSTGYCDPALLSLVSSSSAELYFLSSIIISIFVFLHMC